MQKIQNLLFDDKFRWEYAEKLFAEKLGYDFVPSDWMQQDYISFIEGWLRSYRHLDIFPWEELNEDVERNVLAYRECRDAARKAAASRLPSNSNEENWIMPVDQ